MKFFSPLLWYPTDRIDPGFNCITETTTSGSNPREVSAAKLCGYSYHSEPLADGILMSRTLIDVVTKLRKIRKHYKIDAYGKRFNSILDYADTRGRNFPSFADPGTWSYVNRFDLPEYLYDTDDLIGYYNDMQFDLAGSVDWPIIDRIVQTENGKRKFINLDDKTKEHRRKLTLELAKDFIKKCNRRTISFVPFGTIQGYSVKTYKDSLRQLLKMGYSYIAIGGLPAYSEQHVVELLPIIWKEIERAGYRPGMHLYGRFPSPRYVRTFLKYGVTSFDNNSAHFSAITSPCAFYDPEFIKNYDWESPTNRCYSIKIPPSNGPLLNRMRKSNPEEYWKVEKVTTRTFRLFCIYSKNPTSKNRKQFLRAYKKMEVVINSGRRNPYSENKLSLGYERAKKALKYKGWERCGCTSCKAIGSHIVLVRGHRLRHIFLHNTYVQYTRYLHELKKAKNLVDYPEFNWKQVMSLNRVKNQRKSIRRKS